MLNVASKQSKELPSSLLSGAFVLHKEKHVETGVADERREGFLGDQVLLT